MNRVKFQRHRFACDPGQVIPTLWISHAFVKEGRWTKSDFQIPTNSLFWVAQVETMSAWASHSTSLSLFHQKNGIILLTTSQVMARVPHANGNPKLLRWLGEAAFIVTRLCHAAQARWSPDRALAEPAGSRLPVPRRPRGQTETNGGVHEASHRGRWRDRGGRGTASSGTRGRPIRKFPSLFPLLPSRATAPPPASRAASPALPSESRDKADPGARRGV